MKTVILAGGFGTRLSEYTKLIPKPMVEIGGRPILWHIMNHYASYGFNDFVIALGYKGAVIKNYFLQYYALNHDFTVRHLPDNIRENPCVKSNNSSFFNPSLQSRLNPEFHIISRQGNP